MGARNSLHFENVNKCVLLWQSTAQLFDLIVRCINAGRFCAVNRRRVAKSMATYYFGHLRDVITGCLRLFVDKKVRLDHFLSLLQRLERNFNDLLLMILFDV